jgi:hypothetical protein
MGLNTGEFRHNLIEMATPILEHYLKEEGDKRLDFRLFGGLLGARYYYLLTITFLLNIYNHLHLLILQGYQDFPN